MFRFHPSFSARLTAGLFMMLSLPMTATAQHGMAEAPFYEVPVKSVELRPYSRFGLSKAELRYDEKEDLWDLKYVMPRGLAADRKIEVHLNGGYDERGQLTLKGPLAGATCQPELDEFYMCHVVYNDAKQVMDMKGALALAAQTSATIEAAKMRQAVVRSFGNDPIGRIHLLRVEVND